MNHRIVIDTNTIICLHANDTRPDCFVGHIDEERYATPSAEHWTGHIHFCGCGHTEDYRRGRPGQSFVCRCGKTVHLPVAKDDPIQGALDFWPSPDSQGQDRRSNW